VVMIRLTVHYSGRVQGVGFRYTVQQVAGGFAVAGFVRNLSDGRVEMVCEGDRKELLALMAAVDEAMGDYIHGRTVDESAASGEYGKVEAGGLTIRY